MLIDLNSVILPDWDLGDVIDGISFRWANTDEINNIKSFVNDICPDYVDFYTDSKKILLASIDDDIVGTSIINFDNGMVSCITVKKDYYGKRVGANMIAMGNVLLKKAGVQSSFIGYTDSMDN